MDVYRPKETPSTYGELTEILHTTTEAPLGILNTLQPLGNPRCRVGQGKVVAAALGLLTHWNDWDKGKKKK